MILTFAAPVSSQVPAQQSPDMSHGMQELKQDLQRQDALINQDTKAYYDVLGEALKNLKDTIRNIKDIVAATPQADQTSFQRLQEKYERAKNALEVGKDSFNATSNILTKQNLDALV
jgi:hypothetical protein